MRIPKLKYYYYAMPEQDYLEFEKTRRLDTVQKAHINPVTGEVKERTVLHLCSSAARADTNFRSVHSNYLDPLYVLRIPREYILRQHLQPFVDDVWHYTHSMLIPHCGVERIEVELAAPSLLASSITIAI